MIMPLEAEFGVMPEAQHESRMRDDAMIDDVVLH
jgi:hypothetical protein